MGCQGAGESRRRRRCWKREGGLGGGSCGRPASVSGRLGRGRSGWWFGMGCRGVGPKVGRHRYRENPEGAVETHSPLGASHPHSFLRAEARAPKRVAFAAFRLLDPRRRGPGSGAASLPELRCVGPARGPVRRTLSFSPEGDPETRPRVSPRFGRCGVSPSSVGEKVGDEWRVCNRNPSLFLVVAVCFSRSAKEGIQIGGAQNRCGFHLTVEVSYGFTPDRGDPGPASQEPRGTLRGPCRLVSARSAKDRKTPRGWCLHRLSQFFFL